MGRDYFKDFQYDIRDEELKSAYLNASDYNEDSLISLSYRLVKLGRYEAEIEKSVLDWTSREIEDYLKLLDSKSVINLATVFATVRDYAAFCGVQRQKETGDNVLPNFFADEPLFTVENIARFVNSRKQDESIMTYDEYIELIHQKKYPLVTRTILILLWHGAPVDKMDEIFLLPKTIIDLGNKRIQTKNTMSDGQHEWLSLTDKEVEIIEKFYREQSVDDYEYDGIMWPTVNTSIDLDIEDDGRFYICQPESDKIFHIAVAYNRNTGMLQNKNLEPFSFSTGLARRLFSELVVDINRKSMRPKDIVRSGGLDRFLVKFNITDMEMEDRIVKREWREYLEQYGRITFNEIEIAYKKLNNI